MMNNTASQNSTEFWSRALKVLHPNDKQIISASQYDPRCVVDDVLKEAQAKRDAAVSKRWRFKKSDGSTIILRDVFEKIVRSVSRYTQAVTVAANADPIHAGLPWAVFRFLLQVSVSDVQAFGCLSEGIELVAGVLARYGILENLCISSSPATCTGEQIYLRECIVKVYAAVLTYLATAKRYWSDNTATRIAKSVLKDMEAESQTLQLAVSKADDEAFRTANTIQYRDLYDVSEATREALTCLLVEMRAPILRTAQELSRIQDKSHQDQQTEIFRWLSTVACESHFHEASKKILQDTGRWLLEHPKYLEWQTSSASAIFWLNGIPGSGKSILTSIVIRSLLEQQAKAHAQQTPLAYFYCSKKNADPRTADPKEILCATLRQLTGRDARLALRGTVAQEFQRRKDEADQRGAQILPLDIEEIVAHILAITEEDPVTMVFDALDEVDETEREDLFDALERIVQESPNVVKIFVSSRNDGDIVERFEQYAKIGIEEHLNHNDIETFVRYKVTQAVKTRKLLRGKVSSPLRDDIVKTLTERAQGMFRWVELSVDMLSNSRRLSVEKDVRSELGGLPADLKQQYAIIYKDILESAESTASIAQRVFSWILAAQRALTVEELIAAVALDEDGYYHADLDVPRLLDICRNLIVVISMDDDSEKQSFQVAHLSVKEYLREIPDFAPERIHTFATLRCLQVFNLELVPDNKLAHPARGKADAIRAYTIYLFEHAEMSELTRPSSTKATLMKSFLFDQRFESTAMLKEWEDLIEDFHENSILPEDTKDIPLYKKRAFSDFRAGGIDLICVYGLLSVLETLGNVPDFLWKSYRSKYQSTPLYSAVSNGKYVVAKWLLERNKVLADEAHAHVPPLYTAVWNKEDAIVALLLDYGADPLSGGEEDYVSTPWHIAFEGRSLAIFERLLDSIEHACRTKPEKFSTFAFNWRDEGLFEALQTRWTAAADTLIRHGASIYSRSSRRDTFLAEDHWHSSTLQVAVECSEAATVSLLLETSLKQRLEPMTSKKTPSKLDVTAHQAYLNDVDHHGRSALHYLMGREAAVPEESESIMRMLLRYGADSTAVCGKGITAVHVAAAIGSTDMLSQLKEKGLDMKARSFHGVTILHVAAGGSCETPSLIRYLVHEGMDPLDRDEEGRTPLHYAAAACNTVALEALLEALLGVDDLTQLKAHGSSLPHGYNDGDQSRNELFSRCQMLLNMANNRGESLLHVVGSESSNTLSRYNGDNEHEERVTQVRYTVRLLLELGADMNKRSDEGRTPLSVLLSLGSGPHSGIIAAKELLARSADPDLPDSTGQTPLHHASRCWWEEGVRDLLQAGANIEAVNHDLSTPLHLASRHGFSQVVQLFLQHNADHTARDRHGATPLHYAVQSDGHCVPVLIKKGADLEAADDRGSTPLHWAAKAGQAFHLRLLLSAGADPTTVDRSGTNAMQLSARHASILSEKTANGTDFLNVWAQLYDASKKWCRGRGRRPQKSPLNRSQSLILRTDQSWGDFAQVRAEEFARV